MIERMSKKTEAI